MSAKPERETILAGLRQDYLYEMAHLVGFGAPEMWLNKEPRNFVAYVKWRKNNDATLAAALAEEGRAQ